MKGFMRWKNNMYFSKLNFAFQERDITTDLYRQIASDVNKSALHSYLWI